MSEFKGTPGPWFIDANDVGARWNIDAENGESVALSHQVSKDKDWEKRDANTRLIAAAPELLDTLRQLRDYVQDMYGDSYEDCLPDHPMMLAKSVIEKALGH